MIEDVERIHSDPQADAFIASWGYKYRFNTNELKKPLQDAATSNGWSYKGVQSL